MTRLPFVFCLIRIRCNGPLYLFFLLNLCVCIVKDLWNSFSPSLCWPSFSIYLRNVIEISFSWNISDVTNPLFVSREPSLIMVLFLWHAVVVPKSCSLSKARFISWLSNSTRMSFNVLCHMSGCRYRVLPTYTNNYWSRQNLTRYASRSIYMYIYVGHKMLVHCIWR